MRQGNEGGGDGGASERAAVGIRALLERIASEGQAGADQAGGHAARVCGSATGGRRPRGVRTEGGPRPDGADLYGARELPMGGAAARTIAHARDGDATRGCGAVSTPGARHDRGGPPGEPILPAHQAGVHPAGAQRGGVRRAQGPHAERRRQAREPGIGDRVGWALTDAFRRLGPRSF
ncbi:MAG: hypothetical protein JO034_28540 [Singulisphaera sp.]|nr:hypothetical protein [Singulisphaera sp.]